jgi:GxxExxY protein
MTEDEISKYILDCAFKIHTALGPGLLENVYKTCLAYELNENGLRVETEKHMPLVYRDIKFEFGYRIDLLVDNKVVVEIKTVDSFNDAHIAQTLTYMRLANCKLGILLNFKTKSLKHGIKRLIL